MKDMKPPTGPDPLKPHAFDFHGGSRNKTGDRWPFACGICGKFRADSVHAGHNATDPDPVCETEGLEGEPEVNILEQRLWRIIDAEGPYPVPSDIVDAVARLKMRADGRDQALAENARMRGEFDGLMADFVGVTDNADDPQRLHSWDWLIDSGRFKALADKGGGDAD